jgi:hypothetical protein
MSTAESNVLIYRHHPVGASNMASQNMLRLPFIVNRPMAFAVPSEHALTSSRPCKLDDKFHTL